VDCTIAIQFSYERRGGDDQWPVIFNHAALQNCRMDATPRIQGPRRQPPVECKWRSNEETCLLLPRDALQSLACASERARAELYLIRARVMISNDVPIGIWLQEGLWNG
jgi:hypothetical protein